MQMVLDACGFVGKHTQKRSITLLTQNTPAQSTRKPYFAPPPPATQHTTPTPPITNARYPCHSPDDLVNGRMTTFLDNAVNAHSHTLEKLELVLPHTNIDPSPVYTHALCTNRIPALCSLRIWGFFPASATMSLSFRHLRHLSLRNFYRSLEDTLMSLEEFVGAISTCVELEELEVQRYHPALTVSEETLQSPIVTLPKLRKLTVADAPEFFPRLFSCLRVLPTVDVHLVALFHDPEYPRDGLEAFETFDLERHKECLPILDEVTEVTVATMNTNQEDYGLRIAGSRGEEGGSFLYDIRTTGSIELMEDVMHRCRLLEWAIQRLSKIFPGKECMRRFKGIGDFRDVKEPSWVALFQAYPLLEHLEVEGWGVNDASGLIFALRWLDNAREPGIVDVVCSKLKSISISGVLYTPELMSAARDTLMRRAKPSTQLALQLHMLACDDAAAYPSDARDDDIEFLRKQGVDAAIRVESLLDHLTRVALQCGVPVESVECDNES
ncbi:hypothetical protein DICSQDRAFT_165022 [Dichomitus squalens LYAD-421 SS1]|uniref:uncharacterized protein n=1 Tax=Dichomitus squalens (strain LYAD-421) TaxID=732165 RepID=UPI0004414E1B|nr:uncharacterized protein DICSQDRAFT_165022 [Dichomitus squalens LYAD-421 SS1]EJF67190.1 hypothetical protein DICSQDRAFT_165022 [Dichomitus squalens LYAD-421 SS1]